MTNALTARNVWRKLSYRIIGTERIRRGHSSNQQIVSPVILSGHLDTRLQSSTSGNKHNVVCEYPESSTMSPAHSRNDNDNTNEHEIIGLVELSGTDTALVEMSTLLPVASQRMNERTN